MKIKANFKKLINKKSGNDDNREIQPEKNVQTQFKFSDQSLNPIELKMIEDHKILNL